MCWLFVPRLRAEGWLRIGGHEHHVENELAYHDHNWGRFWWGDDFGWTWGTILSQQPENPWSMVFLRMTDRRRLRCLSQALYVWHDDEPAAIFRHAAVQTRSSGRLGLAADCTLPAPMRLLLDGEVSDVPERVEVERDAGRRHGPRRVPPAVLCPPGPAERSLPGPVDRALRDQRHRQGKWDRSTANTSTSSALAYSSFSMAEQVSSLLRRSVEHLADEVPDSYRLVLERLGPMVVELDVDGELFSLRGGHRLEVADGAAGAAGARITTSRAAILDVLDARSRTWRGRGGGHRSGPRLARRRPACARHSARVRPRRGAGTVAARTASRTPNGAIMTEAIATPASCDRRRTVVVLGAGIAGLTAAHELAERGFDVTVYESRQDERYELGQRTGGHPTRPSSSAASPPPSTRRWAA